MSGESPPDKLATLTAEEVLRTIFGDDLHGCTVSLDTVAKVIRDALQQRSEEDKDLIEMYENLRKDHEALTAKHEELQADVQRLLAQHTRLMQAVRGGPQRAGVYP